LYWRILRLAKISVKTNLFGLGFSAEPQKDNRCKQALAQACAVCSPVAAETSRLAGSMSVMAMLRQLIGEAASPVGRETSNSFFCGQLAGFAMKCVAMNRMLIAPLLLLTCSMLTAQLKYERGIDWNLPDAVMAAFEKNHTLAVYDLSDSLNPFYLRGDFDGDGKPDYAVLVVNKQTKKHGLAVVRSKSASVDILGAGGTKLRVGSGQESYLLDDFDWMNAWHVESRHAVGIALGHEVESKMLGEGIVVEKTESASAVIFWNGRGYEWRQMGD
jgi:hypothetical protein